MTGTCQICNHSVPLNDNHRAAPHPSRMTTKGLCAGTDLSVLE